MKITAQIKGNLGCGVAIAERETAISSSSSMALNKASGYMPLEMTDAVLPPLQGRDYNFGRG
ncbi:hypothetical protein [Nitrosospira sp. NpAV]|uniref:hypothetical protein n=1 Tax=Nitrosospira sp. NpAV TaxID=58133 RepID=UPI0005A15B6B|nr:hypothetical protein [Nitrosospira sp. NpAV]KIO48322.1 hypothetical protein SQ11_11130 [Nitrosospira sp. NpAV]